MDLRTIPDTLITEPEEIHCWDLLNQTTKMADQNPSSVSLPPEMSVTLLETSSKISEILICTIICSSHGVNLSVTISPWLPPKPTNTSTSQFQDVTTSSINSALENNNWALPVQFTKSKEESEPTSTQSPLGLMPVTFMAQIKKLPIASENSRVENWK